MKIVFCLFKYFPFGGLQRDFYSIAMECVARGHTVEVYTLEWQGNIPPELTVHCVSVSAWSNHRRYQQFAKKVHAMLLRSPCDLVVGFNKIPYLDVYFAADPCYLAKMQRTRTFWSYLTARHRCFAQLERAVFGPASTAHIFHLTPSQKQDIQHYYQTPDVRFSLLPVNVHQDRVPGTERQVIRDTLRQELSISPQHFLLLMVGSGFKTKGLDRALLAIAALDRAMREKIHFVVIGQDDPQAFLKLAKKLGIHQQVTIFSGRSDVQRFFLAADLLLHPAYSESAGIVLVEALVASLPVLVTACCGYAHHIATAEAGCVIPEPFVQQTLNQTLQQALNPQQLAKWRQQASAYVATQNFFTMPQQVVARFEQMAPHAMHWQGDTARLCLRGDIAQQWLHQKSEDIFTAIMHLQGKVYRAIEHRKTLKFAYAERDYFAKLHQGSSVKEIIKNLVQLRYPVLGACNEWHALHFLKHLQVDTMTAVGYGINGKHYTTRQSFVLTEALPECITLEDLCSTWVESPPTFRFKLALLKQVAHIASRLHHNGINHRDFYLCHFLLPTHMLHATHMPLTLYLIDLHRAQIRQKTPVRWQVKDLGGLYYSAMQIGLTQRDLYRFMRFYQRATLATVLQDHYYFWDRVEQCAKKLLLRK